MRDAPAFAWVFAAYPILHIAAANPGQASWQSVAWAVAAALLAVTIVVGVARRLVPTWHHAALVAVAVTAAFFAYGPVHTALEESALRAIAAGGVPKLPLERIHALLSGLTLLGVLGGSWALSRLADRRAAGVARALNVAACILLFLVAARMLAAGGNAAAQPRQAAMPTGNATATNAGSLPDIYYIVLDGYARADVLERHYGFDNRGFLSGLQDRGFIVSDASSSNYYWTFLSLSSSLNFDYVQNLLDGTAATSHNRAAAYELIRRNAAADFLRRRGYRVVHVQSTWGATRTNPYADEEISCRGGLFGDEFLRAVAEASWLKVMHARASLDLARCHNSNFDSLEALGAAPGPKFVFAHVLLPHHPYLFDHTGRVLREANLSNQFEFQKRLWERKHEYLEQLQYVNARMLRALESILARSSPSPVIIVQSDHGPQLVDELTEEERMRVRFANLAAYHLPGAPPELMPADGSPVNLFRRLFNHYFDAGLELVPDRHFVSSFGRPFALREVRGVREGRPTVIGLAIPVPQVCATSAACP